jgi:hypothetical protein
MSYEDRMTLEEVLKEMMAEGNEPEDCMRETSKYKKFTVSNGTLSAKDSTKLLSGFISTKSNR